MSWENYHKELIEHRRNAMIQSIMPLINSIPLEQDDVRAAAMEMLHDLYHQDTIADINYLGHEIGNYVTTSLEKHQKVDEISSLNGLAITIYVPDGTPDEDIEKIVLEAVTRANLVHHELGGKGLTLDSIDVLQEVDPQPVPR